jgi:putative flippase GtrA
VGTVNTWRQLRSFLLVGGASYLLNVIVLMCCVELLGLHYVAAMAVSFLVVVSAAHYVNRRVTFRSQASYLQELGKYNVVNLGQFAIGLALMALLVELGRLPYLLANAVAAILLTIVSFVAHKTWTFADRRLDDE